MDFNPEQVCSVWGFGKLEVIKIIKAGGFKTIYLIETNEGRFILTGLGPSITETDFLNYMSALDYLSQKPVKVAPRILRGKDGCLYTKMGNNYVFLEEYIEGRMLTQNPCDEYKLGQTAALLHSFKDYNIVSRLRVKETLESAYKKFDNCPSKDIYSDLLDSLPDFERLRQVFIHTDIATHNAIMTKDGEVVLIDFDGAGKGSVYIDAGFPLITQFVRFQINGELKFNYENARAFYSGYQSVTELKFWERPLIFHGALFWQFMHMPEYLPGGKNEMYQILDFALRNKNALMSAIIDPY